VEKLAIGKHKLLKRQPKVNMYCIVDQDIDQLQAGGQAGH
jgi:hypothetical protein